jgi:hypothetical protein
LESLKESQKYRGFAVVVMVVNFKRGRVIDKWEIPKFNPGYVFNWSKVRQMQARQGS